MDFLKDQSTVMIVLLSGLGSNDSDSMASSETIFSDSPGNLPSDYTELTVFPSDWTERAVVSADDIELFPSQQSLGSSPRALHLMHFPPSRLLIISFPLPSAGPVPRDAVQRDILP